MTKTILTTLIALSSTNAFAFGVQLENNQVVTLSELEGTGTTHVSCGDVEPRCILLGTKYGIQYPDQSLDDVELIYGGSIQSAVSGLKSLKDAELCK